MNTHQVRITILVDDISVPQLMAEHGLSFWIETEDKRFLFDTGQRAALVANARALGVELGEADWLVLSHGHYDHTGGIPQAVEIARNMQIYCHAGVVQPRYIIRDGTPKSIQMPRESMEAFDKLPATRIHWVLQSVQLSGKIGITGSIPRETRYEDTGGPFYLDPEGRHADPIEDDLALWIRTKHGLVICVGCCHAGLVNTLNHVLRLSNESKVRAVIGGFHLLSAGNERLERTVVALRSLEPGMVIPCHCTGERFAEMLKVTLSNRVVSGYAGLTIQF